MGVGSDTLVEGRTVIRNRECLGNRRPGKVISRYVGWTEIYRPASKKKTQLGSTGILRDRRDTANAERLNRRLQLASAH